VHAPPHRCADKGGRSSAERVPERELPVRQEYAWHDIPAGEGETTAEWRLCAAGMVHDPLGIMDFGIPRKVEDPDAERALPHR